MMMALTALGGVAVFAMAFFVIALRHEFQDRRQDAKVLAAVKRGFKYNSAISALKARPDPAIQLGNMHNTAAPPPRRAA